mmetsp:Transcript_18331/g.48384  ORF Transcript_18331/g.48384 Transcript_18331/m.48384 type:complete len:334 (+) Transcript_18331:62-1063(+)
MLKGRLGSAAWFLLGGMCALVLVPFGFMGCQPGLEAAAPTGVLGAHGSAAPAVPRSVVAMSAALSARKPPRVVVSFTTFPLGTRMKGVGSLLRSLAHQTWRPDAVIVNLPDHVERLSSGPLAVPPEFDAWRKEYGWLVVHQTKDYGPATKLLGALEIEKDPDTIIVIVDDDTYYHEQTVAALVGTMLASATDVLPCFQCEEVYSDWHGEQHWRYFGSEGQCRGFASGYAAYAVRPRFFDEAIWDHARGPKGCRLHDDVWISGHALVAAGVRPLLLRPGFDSITGEAIKDLGSRQQESVFVANAKAAKSGEDPQGACVAHFPWLDERAGMHVAV